MSLGTVVTSPHQGAIVSSLWKQPRPCRPLVLVGKPLPCPEEGPPLLLWDTAVQTLTRGRVRQGAPACVRGSVTVESVPPSLSLPQKSHSWSGPGFRASGWTTWSKSGAEGPGVGEGETGGETGASLCRTSGSQQQKPLARGSSIDSYP